MLRAGFFFILASVPLLADLTGRWSPGGTSPEGNAVTGTVEGRPGEPTWKDSGIRSKGFMKGGSRCIRVS